MSDKPTDFGDIVATMLQRKKEEASTKAAEKEAEAARKLNTMQAACAPLLKALEQTKVKFPKFRLYNMDRIDPHFYVGTHTSVIIEYQETTQQFYLNRQSGGITTRLATAEQVEDILPPLLEQLVAAISFCDSRF